MVCLPVITKAQYFVVTSTILTTMSILPTATSSLQVIGSGFARTGTETLQTALNILGYKTYHMKELMKNRHSSHLPIFQKALENNCTKTEDIQALKEMFTDAGYTAVVDFPTSPCWEALMGVFPEAKVVHTERASGENWWDSASDTILIFHFLYPFYIVDKVVPFFVGHTAMLEALYSHLLGKKVTIADEDFPHVYKDGFIASYEENNRRVRKFRPKSRVWIQDHSKGWDGLCQFLGNDIPDVPYPHVNSKKELIEQINRFGIHLTITFFAFVAILIGVGKWSVGLIRNKSKVKDV